MTARGPVLAAVTIAAPDAPGAAAVFEQIIGASPLQEPGRSTFDVARTRLHIVAAANRDKAGLVSVTLSVPSLESHVASLRRAGLPVETREGQPVVPSTFANGIESAFEGPGNPAGARTSGARARLDHVALVVADLRAATERWTLLLGLPPAETGSHPLGDSDAARFLLGDQMVELVSPWPAAVTAMRRRLEASGDGPIALALIAEDLAATVATLRSSGVPLLEQPPHIFVHPKAAGGVLVQLTPRLEHQR